MSFLRFCVSLCFKYLLVSTFIFSLAACSASQPDEVSGGGFGLGSTSIPSDETIVGGNPSFDETVTEGVPSSDGQGAASTAPKKIFKVSWNAPLQREDNTSLALVEIAEYRVYYGSKSRDYNHVIVVDGNSTLEVKAPGVARGTYYVAVTTVDTDGRESTYSKEIIVRV